MFHYYEPPIHMKKYKLSSKKQNINHSAVFLYAPMKAWYPLVL